MAKVIRERGFNPIFEVAKEDRKYVSHNAANIWSPILQVAQNLLLGTAGGLFSMLIWDLLGEDEAKSKILHVEERVIDADGTEHIFKADGKGEDVTKALNEFEQRFR